MQCKDIPDVPVIEFVWDCNNRDVWANWFFGNENDVHAAMPETPNDKLVWAKMNQLIRRGLIEGCTCGCRGDYVVTDKGCEFIGRPRHIRFVGDNPV